MRISELAQRTGSTPRLLRYYEERALLTSERLDNGYRDYPEQAVERVLKIRSLLDAGVPTEIIKDLLPCLKAVGSTEIRTVDEATLRKVRQQKERLDSRIACLSRNRDAVADYLSSLEEQRQRDAGLTSRDDRVVDTQE